MARSRKTGPAPAGSRTPAGARYYTLILLTISVVTIALQAASLGPLRNSFWGFHLFAFLPVAVAPLAWALIVAAALVFLRNRDSPLGVPSILQDRPWAVGAVFTLVALVLFWALRSHQILLGDGVPLTSDLPNGTAFHPRQALTMWLQQKIYHVLGPRFSGDGIEQTVVAHNTVAVFSVVSGVMFVALTVAAAFALTRDAKRSAALPWLCALVICVQGYAVLFFGYVENYPVFTAFIMLYLFLGILYLQERIPLAVVGIVFIVSLGLHLSSVSLAPSLLFLAAWGAWRRRWVDVAVGVVVTVAAFLGLGMLLTAMSPDYHLIDGIQRLLRVARTSQGGGAGASYMFSAVHVRDFFNEHFLVGPLAAFLVVPALAFAVKRKSYRDPMVLFLAATSLMFLAGSWAMSEPLLGYARDWDLFAPAGVCYTVCAVYLILRHVRGPARERILAFAAVFSAVQLLAFVTVNHSQSRTVSRFETLPLGGGREQVVLGNHYLREGNRALAREWFQRALEKNPVNANALAFLGRMAGEDERWAEAKVWFDRAVISRPDKQQFREFSVLTHLKDKDCAGAIENLRWLSQRSPEDLAYWHGVGNDLVSLGCKDALPAIYAPVISHAMKELATRPNDETLNIEIGILLARMDSFPDALKYFEAALRINPKSGIAMYNCGVVLGQMGKIDDATERFRRFLEIAPDHPYAENVRKSLAEMEGR